MTRSAISIRTGRRTTAADPKVLAHFQASAALYRLWSKAGHLHFGYWRWPMSPLDRSAMLEELVHQVVRTLRPLPGQRFADLGSGYGASARVVAGTYNTRVDAFTVVLRQVQEGQRAADLECVDVTMHLRDFRETGLSTGTMHGVYALESLCYGTGHGKRDVLAEAHRILRPGGRIALVDGFIEKAPEGIRGQMVRTVEEGWAVPCFPRRQAFISSLEQLGFSDITIRDLSWHVAPSALHGLPLMVWTELKQRLTGSKLDPLERAHLRSCLYGIALGTQRDLFRYLLITARKP